MSQLKDAHLNFGVPLWSAPYTTNLILFADVFIILEAQETIPKILGAIRRDGEIPSGQKITIPLNFNDDEKRKINENNVRAIVVAFQLDPGTGGGDNYEFHYRAEVILNFEKKVVAGGMYGDAGTIKNNRIRQEHTFDKPFKDAEQFGSGVKG